MISFAHGGVPGDMGVRYGGPRTLTGHDEFSDTSPASPTIQPYR